MSYKKKLIDIAIPLAAINKASSKEKSIRHGHPSTMHLWWARRPLAACRAVLFASLVDDPSSNPERFPTHQDQNKERQRLFKLLEELVLWENSANEELLSAAREEIKASNGGICPAVYDPFSGGGSIPLEAQRLGLKAYGSDLNPVAVMIAKALTEMPVRFANCSPVNPRERDSSLKQDTWQGAFGLAHDIQYYGEKIRERAWEKLKSLYPQAKLPKDLGGGNGTVIAWIWARTVESPNPAFKGIHVPLVRSFTLSSKKGKKCWVEPIISKNKKGYTFEVVKGSGKPSLDGTVSRAGGVCLLSGVSIPFSYIREQSRQGLLKKRLMAVVVESSSGRNFISPDTNDLDTSFNGNSVADVEIENWPGRTNTVTYGLTSFSDLFTNRQLHTLTTFTELVSDIHAEIYADAKAAGRKFDKEKFEEGGSGALAYADAVTAYLGFAIDRCANTLCSLARWTPDRQQTVTVFARQALPMTWDFPEVNPFAEAAGDFKVSLTAIVKTVQSSCTEGRTEGQITLADAMEPYPYKNVVISTDPPYFDNISYSNLSDFFYVWLRASLRNFFPSLFRTIAVPRETELVANPYRHKTKEAAEKFFRDGMTKALEQIKNASTDEIPVTIYYAFKQTEEEENEDESIDAGVVSTGWESFLEALVGAGFSIHGTWPLRTELGNRMLGAETNALASSIVLTCRKRDLKAKSIARREFVSELKRELPLAIASLRESGIAAVDLQQSAIGPGMAVYSRNKSVLESDDSKMSVRSALILINQVLDEVLADSDSSFDSQTRWAISWFEQFGFSQGPFGDATTLAQAKNIGVDALVKAGVISSKSGKAALLSFDSVEDEESPTRETPVWISTLQLIKTLETGGESQTSLLLYELGEIGNLCRDLAYRCFAICQKNSWVQDAARFNALVTSWSEIRRQSLNNPGIQQSLKI